MSEALEELVALLGSEFGFSVGGGCGGGEGLCDFAFVAVDGDGF